MKALSVEDSILKVKLEYNNLLDFIKKNKINISVMLTIDGVCQSLLTHKF